MRVRSRTAAGVIGGAVAVATLGVTLGFGPVVRRAVEARAEAKGIRITIQRVRPGIGRVWLEGVEVHVSDAPSVVAELGRIEATVGPTFAVRSIKVHGGAVTLDGSADLIRSQLTSWRRRAGGAAGHGAGGFTRISGEGIGVRWVASDPGAFEQHAWGVAFERTGPDAVSARADLVRFAYQGLELELAAPRMVLGAQDGKPGVEQLAADGVTARVNLDRWFGDRKVGRPAGASTAPPSASLSGRPLRSASPSGVLSVPPEPLEGQPGEWGPRIHRFLAGVSQAAASAIPSPGAVELAALRLEVQRAGQNITIGPGRLRVERDAKRLRASFRPGAADQDTPLEATLEVPLGGGEVLVDLKGGPVTLTALGIEEGSFGLRRLADADASAQGRIALSADGRRLTFDGRATLRRLGIFQPSLAPDPLTGIDLGFKARGEVALDGSSWRIEGGQLRLGAARVEVLGTVERTDQHVGGDVTVRVPLAACQAFVDAAPRGFAPMLDGVTLSGTFALSANARFDTRRPDATGVELAMANECHIVSVPPALHPKRFSAPWEREVLGADRRRMTIESGPGTPYWVPFARISAHMVTALLICEDSRFFRHQGFDQEAIASALRDNITKQRFFRGASTVSMQLAKNLYLGREKTLARKLEEAVLTMLLEQSLTKEQIIELYLNVVEFGPGIYGIGPAAAHYFASSPAHLSLGQALYLASVLPNPRIQHFGSDGRVTDKWLAYLQKLMHIARKIDRITEVELEAELAEPIAFQQPSRVALAGEGTFGLGSLRDGALDDDRADRAAFDAPETPARVEETAARVPREDP
ncbi:MAG: transglycosylase domain-containing protein [Polyangiaceae bacterium]|nr:transglycosylase domain-containing protein [Polyangiaceae bacterium]